MYELFTHPQEEADKLTAFEFMKQLGKEAVSISKQLEMAKVWQLHCK